MTQANWHDRYSHALMNTFGEPPLLLTRGEGCYVWDDTGKRYLDFLAGIAVNSLGHGHPVLVDAVSRQIATLAHVSNLFANPAQLELAERLKRLAGTGEGGRVFFSNSGTEANEAAFKLARRNSTQPGEKGRRHRILSLQQSFHGRTMGALALTGKAALREPFEPMVPGVEFIDSTIEALEAAVDDTVAALFVEPIKGEAGVLELPHGFLRRARELTQQHGALLIVDEIQTGVGRTGTWFGFEHDGIVPDAFTLAKGLAGGVPIGALVAYGRAAELFTPGQHGTTFGGNPLATAAANAVLGEIEATDLVGNASRRGTQVRELVLGLGSPLVTEVRGRGLLLGVGLVAPLAKDVVAAALSHGLIVNAANESTVRLAPPLIVGDPELADFGERFGAALADVTLQHPDPTEEPA